MGGHGGLSGVKQGRDAILDYFGELGTRSNGSIKANLEDLAIGDRYAIGVHECFEFAEDSAAVADFWS